jgi:hypothetical protein
MKSSTSKKPSSTSKGGSILDRIQDVQDLDLVVTAALYGRSGTGKTTISSTFPKPMLVLDISEKGTDSIRDVKGVKMLPVKSWEDIEDIYWEIADGNAKFATVSIDSVHAMQAMAIDFVKAQRGAKEGEQTTKHDFMRASGLMQEWILNYRDLEDRGINVLFIAHDRTFNAGEEDIDDNQLAPEVGPRLMPSVNSVLCGSVKIVGNTFVREERTKSKRIGERPTRKIQYCLRLGPHSYYTTKVRSPKSSPVPEYLVDPVYEDILEVMKGMTPEPESKTPTTRRRRLS